MAEKPIIFCQDMVRAILAGRKTRTRRVINQKLLHTFDLAFQCGEISSPLEDDRISENDLSYILQFAPYQVGDLLWVKETWEPALIGIPQYNQQRGIIYKADDKDNVTLRHYLEVNVNQWLKYYERGGWCSARFMPKWVARLWLEVTKVRVERVQDITEDDAKAEGIEFADTALDGRLYRDYSCQKLSFTSSPIESYLSLWNFINAKRGFGWDKNPYDFVYDFKVVKK